MAADLQEEVHRRQQARLKRKAATGGLPHRRPSRWAHVRLDELFREAGNVLHKTRRGEGLESGHQPFHGSKSGRCLRIDTSLGLWYCRGCRRGGDALTFWMAKTGQKRRRAAAELAGGFGPPARRPKRRGRPLKLEAVVP